MSRTTPGRGFTSLNESERGAFAAWMGEVIKLNGGRAAFCSKTGIALDNATKYATGRSIPSKINIQRMIDSETIPFSSQEDLAVSAPWMASRYRDAAPKKKKVPAANQEVALPAPAPAPANLMDAIMAEPGLTTKQRAQLVGLVAMVVNGVEINITISPRS